MSERRKFNLRNVELHSKGFIVVKAELFCAFCNQQNEGGPQVICTCGWKDRIVDRESARERDVRSSVRMAVSALAVLLFTLHCMKWGEYSLSIPFYRVGQLTGLLSASGYKNLAAACFSIRHWDCVESANEQIFYKTKDAEFLRVNASVQRRLGKNDRAMAYYGRYLAAGGKNLLAHLEYAALLESKQREKEAIAVYEQALEVSPAESLPVQATAGLVRLETKKGDYAKALNRIITFYALAPNAKGYLNTEFEQLRLLLKKQRQVAHL